jgi:NDP-sugar pyrophosphorylase family protein
MKQFTISHYFDLAGFPYKDLLDGCTTVWDVLRNIEPYLAKRLLGLIDAEEQQYAYLVNPEKISIGEGTLIEPGAYIKGPCLIGKNCHIRHGAYIRGNVIIGDNCVVGHTTELKHTILLNHANAAHFAYIGDSIIGNYVNLGAGTKCANLRLNGEEISVMDDNTLVPTGLRKFGAIIGDFCQVGCNAVLNPGTHLGKHVHVYPCVSIGGVIPEKSVVKNSSVPSVSKQ